MEFKNFLLEINEDGIAVFTANRPEKLNAMDIDSWNSILEFFTWANFAPEVKAIIMTGSGDKAFIAGADINSLAAKKVGDSFDNLAQRANNAIENCGKPVVCAVNGYAFGGGCEIAISCDFRVCSENALFALPETGLGILPGAGGTQRLARLIGIGRAKEMALLGLQYDAEKAVQCGLATKVVPQDQLMAEAYAMCKKLLKKAPLSTKVAKKAIHASFGSNDLGMLIESLSLSALYGTEDKAEGCASFLEKRKPSYKGK